MTVVLGTVAGTVARWWEGPQADVARILTPMPSPWVAIANRLHGVPEDLPEFVWQGFEYPSEGFGMGTLTMDASVALGVTEGLYQIRLRPTGTQVVLIGYSQGAIVTYEIAHRFLPGGELADYELVAVVNFGDPTHPDTGITRYEWDPALLPLLTSHAVVGDMYPLAPHDTYLHLGFLALKGFALNMGDLLKVMMAMIQNDEFVDAIIELLDPLTPGLLDTVIELTGLGSDKAQELIDTKEPVTGGVLGSLMNGVNVGSMLGGIPLIGMGTGFLGGFLGGLTGLGQFGKIIGGLLGGGSGGGGTNEGWVKMGKTFACLLNFAQTNAHYRYGDPTVGPAPGVSCVDAAVRQIREIPAHL